MTKNKEIKLVENLKKHAIYASGSRFGIWITTADPATYGYGYDTDPNDSAGISYFKVLTDVDLDPHRIRIISREPRALTVSVKNNTRRNRGQKQFGDPDLTFYFEADPKPDPDHTLCN
jgi:hypothetical protein